MSKKIEKNYGVFQGANGWYVAEVDDDGSHYQPGSGNYGTKKGAEKALEKHLEREYYDPTVPKHEYDPQDALDYLKGELVGKRGLVFLSPDGEWIAMRRGLLADLAYYMTVDSEYRGSDYDQWIHREGSAHTRHASYEEAVEAAKRIPPRSSVE